jgi:hypothetical protein
MTISGVIILSPAVRGTSTNLRYDVEEGSSVDVEVASGKAARTPSLIKRSSSSEATRSVAMEKPPYASETD